jgi:predicted transcriptional regulator
MHKFFEKIKAIFAGKKHEAKSAVKSSNKLPEVKGKAFKKVLNVISKNPGLKANDIKKKSKLSRNTVFLKLRELQHAKLVENKGQKYYAI